MYGGVKCFTGKTNTALEPTYSYHRLLHPPLPHPLHFPPFPLLFLALFSLDNSLCGRSRLSFSSICSNILFLQLSSLLLLRPLLMCSSVIARISQLLCRIPNGWDGMLTFDFWEILRTKQEKACLGALDP